VKQTPSARILFFHTNLLCVRKIKIWRRVRCTRRVGCTCAQVHLGASTSDSRREKHCVCACAQLQEGQMYLTSCLHLRGTCQEKPIVRNLRRESHSEEKAIARSRLPMPFAAKRSFSPKIEFSTSRNIDFGIYL